MPELWMLVLPAAVAAWCVRRARATPEPVAGETWMRSDDTTRAAVIVRVRDVTEAWVEVAVAEPGRPIAAAVWTHAAWKLWVAGAVRVEVSRG